MICSNEVCTPKVLFSVLFDYSTEFGVWRHLLLSIVCWLYPVPIFRCTHALPVNGGPGLQTEWTKGDVPREAALEYPSQPRYALPTQHPPPSLQLHLQMFYDLQPVCTSAFVICETMNHCLSWGFSSSKSYYSNAQLCPLSLQQSTLCMQGAWSFQGTVLLICCESLAMPLACQGRL